MKKFKTILKQSSIYLYPVIIATTILLLLNIIFIKDLISNTDSLKQTEYVNNESLNETDSSNTSLKFNFQYYKKPILKYFGFLLLTAILLLLMIQFAFYLINRKQMQPFNSIIDNLIKSSELRINFTDKTSEAKIIRKSIESLENQLSQYKNAFEKTLLNNEKIEKDIRLAKKLQNNILPHENSEISKNYNFKLYAYSEAAFDIGGDFYDYFMIDDDHLLITIADVAGKGIPASLFMIYAQTLLRSIAKDKKNVSEITEALNYQLIEEKVSDLFITIFIGILEIKTGKLSFCNAAHNYPLHIKEQGEIEEITDTHGIPIGIYLNRKYTNSIITLAPNDQLFLYTDGLIDSTDENKMKYTVDVLKYNMMGSWFLNPKDVIEKIKNSVVNFRGNNNPEDDMTLFSIKYTPRINKS